MIGLFPNERKRCGLQPDILVTGRPRKSSGRDAELAAVRADLPAGSRFTPAAFMDGWRRPASRLRYRACSSYRRKRQFGRPASRPGRRASETGDVVGSGTMPRERKYDAAEIGVP